MKKSRFYTLLALSSILTLGTAFAATSINDETNRNQGINELNAESLSEDKLYVAPAAVSPYTYTTSPTNEPWYKNSHEYHSTATGSDGFDYQRNQKTTMYDFMNVSETWNSYRGENVKVAVIDTGCYTSHEDFNGTNIKTISKNMVSGTTGLSAVNDAHGHGTTSAATIAAAVNGKGGTGIAPNVELIVLKCVDANNAFSNTAINNALQYCIDNDVDVINMSIQGYNVYSNFSSTYVEDFGNYTVNTTSSGIMTPTQFSTKIKACHDAGITLVAAAGNYNTSKESYPAANDYVIAVGSTGLTSATSKAGYSNYGDWLDISAPGYVYTPSLSGTDQYSVTNGTSFSAPLVTGAIALYKSKYPDATPDQIEEALKATAQPINWQGGAGAVNVGAFLEYAPKSPVSSLALPDETKTLSVGETYQLIPTILPSDASQEVTYGNTDNSVVSISNTGLVTALKAGTSTVTVYSKNTSIYDTVVITVNAVTGEKKTVSKEWTLTSSNTDWTASGNETYFSQPYGYKANGGTLITTNSIEDFTKTNKTEIKVSFKCLQNGGSSSKITIYLYDSSGNVLGSEVFTPVNKNSASNTEYCTATFTSNLTNAAKIGMKVTTFGKNILVNGAKYELTYLDSGATPSVKTLSSISVSNQKTTFTVGETWTFGGTVTATYSDNSTADVTSNVTFSGNTTSSAGQKTVTVSYKEGSVEKTTTYSITVSAPVVTNYTVTFNSNGGSGTMTSKTTTGSTYVVPESNFTKEGYTFDKWALNSTSGSKYAAGTTINNISSNITLYATWIQDLTPQPGDYYKDVDTSSQENLISTLHSTISQGTVDVGYDGLWDAYEKTDLRPGTNYYWDMYSNYNFTKSSPNSNYKKEGDAVNREHTVPQSWFNEKSPMKADLFHVYPTDGYVNNRRSNYPHGDVGNATYTSENGSKLGTASFPGISGTVFEVIDEYKGDFARSYFYMATRYYNTFNDWDSNVIFQKTPPYMTSAFINQYYAWHIADPVSEKEVNRNEAVYGIQKNRNPYIDHPEWVAYAFKGIAPIVGEKTLNSITLSGSQKTEFTVGETFSYTGLVVTAHYSDNTTAIVTPTSVSTPDMNSAGEKTVTVTYTDSTGTKTDTYTITVKSSGVTPEPEKHTTALTLDKTTATIKVGENLTLTATKTPSDSVDGISWSTDNSSIATVSNGVVTGVSPGTATITATSNGIPATCLVEVKSQSTSSTVTASIDFTNSNDSYKDSVGNTWTGAGGNKGNYYRLDSADSITSSSISIDTSKTIDLSLYIGSYGSGTKTLSAYAINSSGTVVTNQVSMSPTSTSSNKFTGTLTFNNTSDSNIKIVFKTTSGSIRFYKGDITYTPLSIGPQVTSISLSESELTFDLYDNYSPQTLTASIEADVGADKTILWTSSDETVATVVDGVVTPHSKGTATITATSKANSEIKATCKVEVTDSSPIPVTGITLNETSATLIIGSTLTLEATITPTNATNKNISWSSNNENIATVSDGLVTSKAIGTAIITVTTDDGGFTATCTITVSAAPVITYQLEADETEVPFMSGTNHIASVGVKLYQYTNGVKGNQVSSGSSNVDTSSLGNKTISYIYQDITYETIVKVTNYGADVGLPTQLDPVTNNITSSFTVTSSTTSSWSMPTGWTVTSSGTTGYEANRGIQLQKNAKISFVLPSYKNITSISLDVARSSNGSGSFTVTVDDELVKTISSFNTTKTTQTIKFDEAKSGVIKIDGSASASSLYIKAISINYQEIVEGQLIEHNATPNQQAIAWSDYFIKLTGGGAFDGPCKESTPEARRAALQEIWGEVSAEYGYMVNGSKDAFCDSSATGSISEAMQHYSYIVDTYGLDNFVKDGSGNAPARISNKNFLITNVNSVTVVTAIIVMVGAMSVGAYFFYKKRKSDVE